MTLTDISKYVCIALEANYDDVFSMVRNEELIKVRHVWRTIAHKEFKFTPTDIGKFERSAKGDKSPNLNKARSSVYHSAKTINDGVFKREYDIALNYINSISESPAVKVNEAVMDGNIVRVTQDAFSERFYGCDEKTNIVSGNKWFPSWHYLYGTGCPSEEFLIEYYKSKGYFSDFNFYRAQVMGSYVHNRIEDMGKFGIDTTTEQIYRAFPNAKEARKIEESLIAWINFVKEEEPQVLSYEQMVIAEDWGGTVDLRARLKRDNYESIWTIDFKTSKSIYDSHKSQVESYRREFKDDKAAVLLLGNSTKSKYTFSEVKEKERDYFYEDFLNIKRVAYHRLKKQNRLQPHEKDMPEVFTLKGLNITQI